MEVKPTKEQLQTMGLTGRDWYRTVYLKSEHWLRLRELALALHGRECAKCHATKHLDVHHLRYREIYDVLPEDLQILCRPCHDLEHPQEKARQQPSQKPKKGKRGNRKQKPQKIDPSKLSPLEIDELVAKYTKARPDAEIPEKAGIRKVLKKHRQEISKYERRRLKKRMRFLYRMFKADQSEPKPERPKVIHWSANPF
jgi:hypothetical protein